MVGKKHKLALCSREGGLQACFVGVTLCTAQVQAEKAQPGAPKVEAQGKEKLQKTPKKQSGPGSEQAVAPEGQGSEEEIEVIVETGTRRGQVREQAVNRTLVLSQDTLEASMAPTLESALEGVSALEQDANAHGGAPTMHGLEPEHLLILRDGQRVTGRTAGRVDMSRFYSLRYEAVEWVPGRASSLYGSDAIAGVLNLKTHWPKAGWEPKLRASLGNRAYLSGFAGMGWANDTWSWMVSAAGMRASAFDLTPDTPSTSGDAMRNGDAELGVRWRPGSGFELSFLGGYGDQTFQGIDQNAAGAILLRTNRSLAPRADLKASWFFDRAKTQATLHYDALLNRLQYDQRGDDALDRISRTRDHVNSLELLHHQKVGERHWLSAGGQAQVEHMTGERIGQGRRLRPRVSLFAQDEWLLGEARAWTLAPSARLDWDRYFGWSITPQLSMMWSFRERLFLRASLGRGYRAPSFKDLFLVWNNPIAGYRVRGNPNLRPESSWGANASLDFKIDQNFSIDVQVFEQRLRGLIAPNPGREPEFDGLTFRYQNVGKATTRGVEPGGRARFDTSSTQINVSGGYRYLYTVNHERSRPLQGRAPHRARLRGAFLFKPWGSSISLHSSLNLGQAFFVASTVDDQEVVQKKVLDPQWCLRLALRQRLFRSFAMFGRIENLLNAGDPEFAPLAQRAFFVGLEWVP